MKPPFFRNDSDQDPTYIHNLDPYPAEKKSFGMVPYVVAGGIVALSVVGGLFLWNSLQNNGETVASQYVTPIVPTIDSSQSSSSDSQIKSPIFSDSSESGNTDLKTGSDTTTAQKDQNSSVAGITRDTYAPSSGTNNGVSGYQSGAYINDYRVNIRPSASTDGESKGLIQIGNTIEITQTTAAGNRVWGKRSDGTWVCLKEGDVIYAFGPGSYTASKALPLMSYAGSGTSIGTIESGWTFEVERVQKQGEKFWGILKDGNAVEICQDQTAFVTR